MTTKNWTIHFTTIGIAVFPFLFLYAASLYSGGSQADLNSIGYDWVHNYWCNLLNVKAMNGELNLARPFAISAMVLLCASLAVFFFNFPKYLPLNPFWDQTIQITGVLSMVTAAFIFTDYHDLMTMIASFFGLFALIGIILGLRKNKKTSFIKTALGCIILLGINNYIYYTQHFLVYLPLLQKITFAVVLIWISFLNASFEFVVPSCRCVKFQTNCVLVLKSLFDEYLALFD